MAWSNANASSTTQGTGTALTRFRIIAGSDMTPAREGSGLVPIRTFHHTITVMREYENKSLEELRYEDYCNGRSAKAKLRDLQSPRRILTFGSGSSDLNLSTNQNPGVASNNTGARSTVSMPTFTFSANNNNNNLPLFSFISPQNNPNQSNVFGNNSSTSTFRFSLPQQQQQNGENGSIFGNPPPQNQNQVTRRRIRVERVQSSPQNGSSFSFSNPTSNNNNAGFLWNNNPALHAFPLWTGVAQNPNQSLFGGHLFPSLNQQQQHNAPAFAFGGGSTNWAPANQHQLQPFSGQNANPGRQLVFSQESRFMPFAQSQGISLPPFGTVTTPQQQQNGLGNVSLQSTITPVFGTPNAPQQQNVFGGALQLPDDKTFRLVSKFGLILLRAGYYLKPEPCILENMDKDDNGSCYVAPLTIGRKGFGNVTFLKPVNLTNLNLDSIIQFSESGLVVYPGPEEKPKIGTGLMKPMIIQLEKIWPVDKTNGTIYRCPITIRALRFSDTLKNACSQMGAKFIAYSEADGKWTFKVDKKFSDKYGINPVVG